MPGASARRLTGRPAPGSQEGGSQGRGDGHPEPPGATGGSPAWAEQAPGGFTRAAPANRRRLL